MSGPGYTAADLMRPAKRIRNARRGYLFVNPLQAKHMPVSPSEALAMMRTLGRKIQEQYDDVRLVVGFAETATAVGAAAASEAADGSVPYIQTTREAERFSAMSNAREWIDFTEAHSHAQQQRLCADALEPVFSGAPGTMVLIDDEISTGRTCLDLLDKVGERHDLTDWRVVLASLLTSCSAEDARKLAGRGIETVSLAALPEEDYEGTVRSFEAAEPEEAAGTMPLAADVQRIERFCLPDARLGVSSGAFEREISSFCGKAAEQILRLLPEGAKKVSILGTEECMYPAIRLGEMLEQTYDLAVLSHSTTRSPIGICTSPDYPVQSGHALRSFYVDDRRTFLYNAAPADALVVVTDARRDATAALDDLRRAYGDLPVILAEV